MEKKICKRCLVEKELDKFYKKSRYKDGKDVICIDCAKYLNKEYHHSEAGKKSKKRRKQRYEQTHKYKTNCLKNKEKMYHYYEKYNNTEKYRSKRKDYYKTEKGKISRKNDHIRVLKLYPEKYEARYKLMNAIRSGEIIKLNICSKCDSNKDIQGHHEDYSKPLDVIWLCRECHRNLHKERGTWKR